MKKEHLKYELAANALMPGAGGFSLKVVEQDMLSGDAAIDELHALAPDVPHEHLVKVSGAYTKLFVNNARKGRGIKLPFCVMTHTIHGPHRNADGAFNPATDSICVIMQPGKVVAEAGAKAAAYKVDANYAGPVIGGVTDLTLKSTNGRITRGGYIRIIGARLKLTGPRAAVVFEPVDGVSVKADITKVLVNKPSEVLLLVPDSLPPGTCRITHITHYTPSGHTLKTPHSTTFGMLLTVV
jgi:hypothetical protein